MNAYRHILADELTKADLRRRRRRLGLARRTRWLFGHARVVDCLLRRDLARLTERGGFAVPSAWGVAAGGRELRFDCPPDQLDRQLADWVGRGDERWHLSDYFVGAGDWRPLLRLGDDTSVAREAAELAACDLDFRATQAYAALVAAAREGRPVRRQQILLEDTRRIDDYFESFVALFRSIGEVGLLRRESLCASRGAARYERDVGVAIGRDGELYRLPGGQHRTAIARILGLPRMPVEARLFHAEWLLGVMKGDTRSPLQAIGAGLSAVR